MTPCPKLSCRKPGLLSAVRLVSHLRVLTGGAYDTKTCTKTRRQVRTLGGRLSFLLNKMQSDEESRVILKEESKKTEAQVS